LKRNEAVVPRVGEATDLSAAMKLASSMFPDSCSRRIVLVTDGNENLGSASQMATFYASQGIGIDVVAVPMPLTSDVAIEKLIAPSTMQRGAAAEIRAVIVNDSFNESDGGPRSIAGKLTVTRRSGTNVETLADKVPEIAGGVSDVCPTAVVDQQAAN
jgi:hypothetical protein